MTLLLTGGSGLIGRHVLPLVAGRQLRLLVQPGDPLLPELREHAEVVLADLTRPETLPPALDGVRQVIHLAGLSSGGRGTPQEFLEVNARGTGHLARAARKAGVEHFLYSSSITVYGHVRDADETAPLILTPGYPTSKIAADGAVRRYLPEVYTVPRLPLVLGAGDRGFLCPAAAGFHRAGWVVIPGSGRAPWTVLSAKDAAWAFVLALDLPESARGRTFNVGGEAVTTESLLRAIGFGAGCRGELRLPSRLLGLSAALANVLGVTGMTGEQVRALSRPLSQSGSRFAGLGFRVMQPWGEALREGLQWCREQGFLTR